jgi:hypothetical protein
MFHRVMTRLAPVFLFAALLLLARAHPVFAADQVVTNCGDDTELRSKLTTMQSSGGGTLTFNCGTASIKLASLLPTISTATTVDGGNKITLNGQNGTQIFYVNSSGTLNLKNIVLTNGSSGGDGGAIYNSYGWVILNHTTIQNSTAAGSGGAIVTYGQLNINDSILAYNKGANGGAIYPRWSAAQVTIQNSVLHHNQTTSPSDGWGGAILLWDGAAVGILNSELYSNTARHGGAIYNSFANSSVSIQDSIVRDNKATNGNGGGIYTTNGGLTTNNVTISGNTATNVGGGIMLDAAMSSSIVKTTFSGNSSDSGGGGIFIGHGNAVVTIQNSTISGNAAAFGGAIDVIKAKVTATNVTIFGNSATLGASGLENGTYSNEGTTLKNTIIGGSLAGANCHDVNAQTIISADGNLSDDTSCSAYFNKAHDLNGSTNNPMLGPLTSNGGFTQTHLPQSGSPVLNAGIASGAPTTDQRGVTRPQGFAVDMGAVERCETKPSKPVLVSPGNNTKVKGKTIVLDWNDVPCTQTYTVILKLGSPTGTKVQKKTKLTDSAFTTKALVRGQTYYWQITAVGDAGKSKSAWWSFKVK